MAPYLTHNLGMLPKHRYVGILSCQNDPLLQTLESIVISCTKTGKEFQIELEDTIMFPEGGGQPSDIGSLRYSEGNKEVVVEISRVERKALIALHYSTQEIAVGTRVTLDYDLKRRNDLTIHHTAQHLLSGIMENQDLIKTTFKTVAWGLTDYPRACYIELEGTPSAEEIQVISDIANDFISRKNAKIEVKVELVGVDGVVLPDSVPDDYVGGGVLRTVEIMGLDDKNPCCGTHYPTLSYLQAVYVYPSTTSIRSTNSRLFFIAGPRLLHTLSESSRSLKTAALDLNVAQEEVSNRVKILVEESTKSKKREKKLREEIAQSLIKRIWDQAGAGEDVKSGLLFRNQAEQEFTNDLEFINLISFGISTLILATPPKKYLFIFTTATPTLSPSPSGFLVMIGTKDCNEIACPFDLDLLIKLLYSEDHSMFTAAEAKTVQIELSHRTVSSVAY